MPNNYQLRSRDVQEVLNTPPKLYILWGNTIIVGLLIVFLIMLKTYQVPVESTLPFRVSKIDPAQKDTVNIYIYITTPISMDYKPRYVELNINQYSTLGAGKVRAAVKSVNPGDNTICLRLLSDKSNFIISDTGNKLRIMEGMFGTLESKSGSISLLKLFLNKLTNRKHQS